MADPQFVLGKGSPALDRKAKPVLFDVFGGLAAVVTVGACLRHLLPSLDVDRLRPQLNLLVLYVLLPALIFDTLSRAPLDRELLLVPLSLLSSILVGLALAVPLFSRLRLPRPTAGALMLASAFGNVTYLGLPVLLGLFPASPGAVTEVAILCEITKTPVNLSLGAALAAWYGSSGQNWRSCLGRVARLPPLWAAALALALKLSGAPVPGLVHEAVSVLGGSVTALMLLSLGMALRPSILPRWWTMIPVLLIKLAVCPLTVLLVARALSVPNPYLQAVVLEGGMPCQLLTFVIADHFGLDVARLAVVVLVTTALSFFTLPLWAGYLGV